jgi:hypothetical protein
MSDQSIFITSSSAFPHCSSVTYWSFKPSNISFSHQVGSLHFPCEDSWRFPAWRRQLHRILTTPSAGPSLRSVLGVPRWRHVWDDIPTASWPKDAIHRCRRLYRALRRPKLVRTPFGVRDFKNFGRWAYLNESVLSYVDDFYLTRVEYPSRSAIFEHFRAGFQAGSFYTKSTCRGVSHTCLCCLVTRLLMVRR